MLEKQQAQYQDELDNILKHSSNTNEKAHPFIHQDTDVKESADHGINSSLRKTALLASEIATNTNRNNSQAESEQHVYAMRRSPFIQRQMAKGKRFDRSATIKEKPVNKSNQEKYRI